VKSVAAGVAVYVLALRKIALSVPSEARI